MLMQNEDLEESRKYNTPRVKKNIVWTVEQIQYRMMQLIRVNRAKLSFFF